MTWRECKPAWRRGGFVMRRCSNTAALQRGVELMHRSGGDTVK